VSARARLAALLLAATVCAGPAAAQTARPSGLSAALIDEAVLVTSSFTGAKITVFGAARPSARGRTDIVVLVRGPDRPAWIGERKRVAGLWVGQTRLAFAAAPTYFGVASARPLPQISRDDTLSLYGLTPLGQLDVAPSPLAPTTQDRLKRAFVAERQKQRLYVEESTAVKLLPGGLFRADLRMPDKTPPGLYTAKVMVFRNGRPAESTLSTLVVSKVGVERALFEFARDNRVLHGLTGVALAMLSGFVAARVFRRWSGP
jgi:uncharacterized protein (TIGR02186 family)